VTAPPTCDRHNLLVDAMQRRRFLGALFAKALDAIDPEPLTRNALLDSGAEPATLVAVGKAAPAMCRGAGQALESVGGICVGIERDAVPRGVSLVVGNHPVPDAASFFAGEQVLEVVARSHDRIVALISGGGSALCEYPIEGVPHRFVSEVNRELLRVGASIDEVNLVRRHLSAIKGGRLLRFATAPVQTFVISDVCGADPSVVASGPTVPQPHDPAAALGVLTRLGIDVPPAIGAAIEAEIDDLPARGPVTVLADGKTAVSAIVEAANTADVPSTAVETWLRGDVGDTLANFIETARPGITVASGEPKVAVHGDGIGGRNTHAALMAARLITGTDFVFGAFATDGLDGNSASAGAIVDGATLERGGDPGEALARSDSATYLDRAGDLVRTGPTGTNVADIWVLWR